MAENLRSLQSQLCPIPTKETWSLGQNERSHKLIHGAIDKIVSHTPTTHTTRLLGEIEKWHGTLHITLTVKYPISTVSAHIHASSDSEWTPPCLNVSLQKNFCGFKLTTYVPPTASPVPSILITGTTEPVAPSPPTNVSCSTTTTTDGAKELKNQSTPQ